MPPKVRKGTQVGKKYKLSIKEVETTKAPLSIRWKIYKLNMLKTFTSVICKTDIKSIIFHGILSFRRKY